MKFRACLLVPAFAILATAAALGAENPAARHAPPGLLWFIILGPLVLIFLFVAVVVESAKARRRRAEQAETREHHRAQAEHLANLEQKTDRLIALLESIDRKLGDRA